VHAAAYSANREVAREKVIFRLTLWFKSITLEGIQRRWQCLLSVRGGWIQETAMHTTRLPEEGEAPGPDCHKR
jgi:hypothetical protein